MVNSITMNIDVREYLRINPISVHELSLSDNGNDCFLFFPKDSDTRGYRVFTQTQLFRAIQRSIFENLLDYTTEPPRIKGVGAAVSLDEDQFKNYVEREEVEEFEGQFDAEVTQMASDLDDIILALKRKGILKYQGAVELQSVNARMELLSWPASPVLGVGVSGPIYSRMSYAEG